MFFSMKLKSFELLITLYFIASARPFRISLIANVFRKFGSMNVAVG